MQGSKVAEPRIKLRPVGKLVLLDLAPSPRARRAVNRSNVLGAQRLVSAVPPAPLTENGVIHVAPRRVARWRRGRSQESVRRQTRAPGMSRSPLNPSLVGIRNGLVHEDAREVALLAEVVGSGYPEDHVQRCRVDDVPEYLEARLV